ncbi:GCN1 domain-containing protein [Cryptosporidium canis]|uniref:GCN1 domain-containing protein n=1 Tax=Cryptosporidium canis TaxID=195482 RepID=A0A9D5DFR2_9CRYT|nr:GCN1 domain-containing protein [Cryptosporidium canis]
MEPEAELVRCENVLDSNEGARRVPDLDVFSGGREDEVLKLAKAEMEILRRQAGLVQNKFYRNIWNKFVSEFGVWLRRNDEPAFLESFLSLSSRAVTLEAGFWLLGGFLSIGGLELQESSRGRILEILKLVHLSHAQSVHCLKKREYRFVVSLYSKFFQEYSPDTWREWILVELSTITGSQGLTSQQRLILDIVLHYVENIHSDEGLTNELVLGVANGLPSIFASDVDSYFRMSLESIARALPSCGKELSPLVNALLRQLKRYSSKPCSQAISASIGGILSNGSKSDQGYGDVHIIQSSLDICFQLIPSHLDLREWLEETVLTILSSKTTDQTKVSLMLVVASIYECLARRRLEGVSVSFDITHKTQDLLLLLVDIKLPMVSSQSSDHIKALAVHICSLSYVLLNGSRSHPFSGKFLEKIQSLIRDQSISDACRLLVVSSFAHSILLLKKLGVTSDGDSFDKSRVSQIIINNGHVSGIFGSALSKTANLKRLSIIVLGQLISIQDVFDEADIFKSLDVVQSLQSSSQLLPRLGALVEGSYSLVPCSTNVAEVSILMVLMEVMFSPSSVSNFSIEFQKSQDSGSMDLMSCLQTMASPNKIQSANYLIGFLIQMGRVMSFMPDNGDLSVSLAQYSAVNMEAFQASLMLPGLKRPIVSCAGWGGSLQEASHLPVSWAGLRELGSFFSNECFCRSLILAFATILSSFNSLIRREEEQGGRSDEASSELLLRKIDLFKVWVFLGRLEMLSKDRPSKIGYQYYAIFLLCSYHPLLYLGCSPLGDREERPGSRHSAAVHGDVIRDLVQVWHGSEETRRALNEALLEMYLDLVYLPVDEATGFRVAGMNLLNILKLTKDSSFTLCLVERLKLQVKSSLEFLNSLPREFGDFVVSDPSQPFEFNLHLAGPQNPDQGFIQDMEGSISARIKSFTGAEAKYGNFSEVYSSIANASSWLSKSLSSLDADSSLVRTGDRDSGEKPASKGRDSEPEPASKGPGSSKTASPTKPATTSSPSPATTATSAFALAKLRKSQADSKTKAGKVAKPPAPHACNANAKAHANSHDFGSLSTCSGGVGTNSSACGSNLTKEDIWRQRLGEQGNLRRVAERIVSKIRICVEVMLGVLVSCVSGADGMSEEVSRMDLEMSEVLYLVCSRMLEFRPLRHFGLCILERLVLESNRLGRAMVDYLSRQDEEGRDACLQEMFDLLQWGLDLGVYNFKGAVHQLRGEETGLGQTGPDIWPVDSVFVRVHEVWWVKGFDHAVGEYVVSVCIGSGGFGGAGPVFASIEDVGFGAEARVHCGGGLDFFDADFCESKDQADSPGVVEEGTGRLQDGDQLLRFDESERCKGGPGV